MFRPPVTTLIANIWNKPGTGPKVAVVIAMLFLFPFYLLWLPFDLAIGLVNKFGKPARPLIVDGLVSLDLETTGLNPHRDEILSVGIVDESGKVIMNELVRPRLVRNWPGAQKVNGITPSMVADKPPIREFVPRIQEILDSANAVLIYNKRFDLSFLSAVGIKCHVPVIDVMFEYAEFSGSGIERLVDAASDMGVILSNAHDACSDARATLEVHLGIPKDFRDYWASIGQLAVDMRSGYSTRPNPRRERALKICEATPKPMIRPVSIDGDDLPLHSGSYLCVVAVDVDENGVIYEKQRTYCADSETIERVMPDARRLLASLDHGEPFLPLLDSVHEVQKVPDFESLILENTVTVRYRPLTETGRKTKFPMVVRVFGQSGNRSCRVQLHYREDGSVGRADIRTFDFQDEINSRLRERDGELVHVKSTLTKDGDQTVLFDLDASD